VHNLALNRVRQSSRRGPHVPLETADAVVSSPPAQEQGLRHRDLLRALQTLPEEQRSVVLLVSVEDLSYAEVAEVLKIPIGTVMSRLSRGRERLRLAMEGATEAEPVGAPHLRRVK